nr:hypothetical protein [Tanacetum cinerariifolium]
MANLLEDIQWAGSDTRPPMLDRTDFASWQQCIRLYCLGKENEFGPERPRVYSDLTPDEKDRYNADIRATNILLQGLRKDIYTLINHYTDAKDIWDNHKGESIHYYYIWFAKLINDMRNIKMTMSRMQLNSMFVNNMLPEWGRFVTAVKLNRGLRDSNYDQLYAYLKQHETHAKENKMMLERFSQNTMDPLALMSNVSNPQLYSPSSSTSSSTQVPQPLVDNPHLDLSLFPAKNLIKNLTNTLALLTQSYKTFLPQTNNQLRTSSNLDMGELRTELGMSIRSSEIGSSKTDEVLQLQRVALDVEKLLFLIGRQGNAFDDDVDEQPVHDLSLNVDNVFQADNYDAFDSDVDEAPTAQTMFMVNLSSADPVTDEAGPLYDSDILSEYVKDNEVPVVHSDVSFVPNDAFMMIYNDMCEPHAQSVSNLSRNTVVKNSLTAELATFKEHVELPKPYYNELNKVAIGYKNPLCLTRAKQVKPALYNGHEIIKDSHALAIVHNTEDTLEMVEITKKKMNVKMNDPECVTRKVKIAPHDYSKDNFLATFTPQKQLTPEQIFWSNDLIKLKYEALKEQSTVFRPIKALTVLTEGERSFEQTKECYLKEVIPFFKTLKDNFEGIRKALTKEIKEMKDVFEELKAEVAQYAVDRKHDATEQKNLLIANDNLIAECLSKEVFSVATNFELNVARFTEMTIAHTDVEARCLELEAELDKLRNTSHHDNQEELINRFSKLEVNHLNLQLKYQNLKDNFRNNPSTPDKDTPDFDSVFIIGKMQASLQGKDNVIRQLKKQISQLQVTRSDTDRTLKHYKELYDSIKITRAKHMEQVTALTTKNVNMKAQTLEKVNNVSKDQVKPKVLAQGKHAIDVKPIVPHLRNNRDAYLDYLRHLKESVETIRHIVEEAKVVSLLDRSIVSACRYTKHSQELLEYAIGTCPQGSQQRAKQLAHISLIRKKQVTFAKPSAKSDSNTHQHVVTVKPQKTNVHVPPSTGVNSCPNASGSQPKSNVKPNRISPAKGVNKLPVEDRKNKSHFRTSNRIDSSSFLKRTVINSNSDSICQPCNKCLTSSNHDMCV